MIVLLILIFSFGLSHLLFELMAGAPNILYSGNIAMCITLWFTGIGHFRYLNGMAKMIPSIIPLKKALVVLTGVIEIVAGTGLLFPETRYYSGLFLIIFFIVILPANINAAARNLDYQTGTYTGNGLRYLWFRIPLQFLLIAWVWFFSIQNIYSFH